MLFNAQDIARLFDARDRVRGHTYQTQGHVKDVQLDTQGARLSALVQGTANSPYRVDIEIGKRGGRATIQSYCSCPVGYMCKHGAATLFEAIAQDSRKHERIGDFTLAGRKGAAAALSTQTLGWLKNLKAGENNASLQDSRLIYILAQDEKGGGSLIVTPYSQHKLRDGGWSGKKNVGYGQATMMRQQGSLYHEQDKGIFLLLKDHYGSQLPHIAWSFDTDGDYVDFIVTRILSTGRAFLDHENTSPLIRGKDEEGHLSWTLLPDMRQRPTIAPAGRDLTPLFLPSPWYVNVANGAMGRLVCREEAQIVARFLKAPPITQNETPAVRKAMKEIDAPLPAPFKIRDMKDKLETPSAHLNLVQTPKGEQTARLSFTYGEEGTASTLTPTHYTAVKDDEIRLYKRNGAAEKKLLKKLEQHHLMPAPHPLGDFASAQPSLLLPDETASPWFWLDIRHTGRALLEAEGFVISDNAPQPAIILEPDSEDIDASFEQTGDWWFSMDLGITIGGERIPLLPILVAMIKKLNAHADIDRLTEGGKCYAPLPDGRMIALPADRIRTILKTLVELFDDKALNKDGTLRVSMDLTAAFLKLEAITSKRWLGEGGLRKLIEKLGNFEGIKKRALPKKLDATLRPYQIDGYNWLHFLGEYGLSGILADDMGLGKTIQTLAYIQSLKESKKLEDPCLIVMPTSLIANWQAEAAKFTPSLKVLTLHGKERFTRFSKTEHYDVVLTTYPLLPRDSEKLAGQKWSLLILDEAQAIKNPAAKMTQAACSLKAKQRICLTGTPVENHLGEAWSIFTFLMPGLLGDHKKFTKHYRAPIEKDGDNDRKNLFARRLRPFVLRRLKSEVEKDLPPKTEIIRHVTLADDQRDLYEAVRHVMNDKVRDEIAAKGLARSQIVILDALLKLRQTCCDPRLVKLEAARKVKSSAKLDELMEMIPTLIEEGRKILLFSQFTSMLDLIKLEVEKLDIPYVELRGTTKDRATPVKRFQAGEVPLFLISLKAGGTGLNLTAADTVIHYDPWWNPSVENQATDRAHRIGQTKHVFVYKMIAEGTVEERIVELQGRKAGLAAALFGDKPAAAASLTQDDIKWLMGG
ncbi:MAG: DEAD/DEAH box helicase [Bdellovibrionales bacterium]